jgi:hypothetical protein
MEKALAERRIEYSGAAVSRASPGRPAGSGSRASAGLCCPLGGGTAPAILVVATGPVSAPRQVPLGGKAVACGAGKPIERQSARN